MPERQQISKRQVADRSRISYLSFALAETSQPRCRLMAGSSQGGVQVGRRKPVTQGDPAREILAGSPTAGDGRTTPPAEHSASLFLAPKSHIDGPKFNMNGNHVTRRKAARRASFHRRQAAPTFPGCVRGIPGEARTVRAQRVPQPRKEYPVRVHPATVTPRRS